MVSSVNHMIFHPFGDGKSQLPLPKSSYFVANFDETPHVPNGARKLCETKTGRERLV